MNFIVTGGGTGGHIYPALAVAACLLENPDVESVVYIGKTGALESELAPQAGLPFNGITFYGMPRGKSPIALVKILLWTGHLSRACLQAMAYLKANRPDVVFGTGGYVSAPVLLAAKFLKIPFAIHEPDAQPGLANRLMGRYADLITTSFSVGAEKLQHNPRQTVRITGNPIRKELGQLFSQAEKNQARAQLGEHWPVERPILLVTGGSQGARRLNLALVEALPTLLEEWRIGVLHLTGRKLYEETMAALDAIDPALRHHCAYQVLPFNHDMASWLTIADVALCRAGSLSLSEMYACGLPTLLVPYPFAAADHQRRNAEASVEAGASFMLEDSSFTGAALLEKLEPLFKNPTTYATMRQTTLALAHPEATQAIAQSLRSLAQQKNRT
jgi:UDP-N-acetylglucosamine--N-acetylmuramyl-(pentapeptide) pyrophosphoryl-undecaprenol N-acetylglucosamine transferase